MTTSIQTTPPSDLSQLSFEQALTELETIVSRLENGESNLESAVTEYEKGMNLKAYCETRLKAAQSRIEKISVSANGDVKSEDF